MELLTDVFWVSVLAFLCGVVITRGLL